jgi:membrane associated rhomboid family serine protease
MTGIVATIFLYIFFVINWFMWIGNWINEVASRAIVDGSLTGVEAFFYSNVNFIVFIGITLGAMGFMYFSTAQ